MKFDNFKISHLNLAIAQISAIGQQLVGLVDAEHTVGRHLSIGHLFAVFEAQLMISRNDDLHLVRQFAHLRVEFDHLADVAVVGEVAGVDEDVAVGDEMHDFVQLLVSVRDADETHLRLVDRSVESGKI